MNWFSYCIYILLRIAICIYLSMSNANRYIKQDDIIVLNMVAQDFCIGIGHFLPDERMNDEFLVFPICKRIHIHIIKGSDFFQIFFLTETKLAASFGGLRVGWLVGGRFFHMKSSK